MPERRGDGPAERCADRPEEVAKRGFCEPRAGGGCYCKFRVICQTAIGLESARFKTKFEWKRARARQESASCYVRVQAREVRRLKGPTWERPTDRG